jgi:cytochrome c peroxidase
LPFFYKRDLLKFPYKYLKKIVYLEIFLFLVLGCNSNEFNYPKIEHPKDNLPSKVRIELGKKLFFDPILSQNKTTSCASCHKPEFAFADTVSVVVSNQLDIVDRNVPTLMYVGYKPALFAEGGVKTLEQQAVAPFLTTHEFGLDIHAAAERLKSIPEYQKLFKKAYKAEPNALDITKALAVYQRSLAPFSSKYDQFLKGDLNALSIEEKAGLNLFNSESLGCSNCHSGVLFTNHKFEKSIAPSADKGRARFTRNKNDNHKFMVPTLRNIAVTYPYLHNGSVNYLEELIELYTTDSLSGYTNLTKQEIEYVSAFLMALTDEEF